MYRSTDRWDNSEIYNVMILCRQKAAQEERWAGVVIKPVSQTGLVSNGWID
jgi:hypothetical protein